MSACSDCGFDNTGMPTWLQRPLRRVVDHHGGRQVCTYCVVNLNADADSGRIDLTLFISPVAVTA